MAETKAAEKKAPAKKAPEADLPDTPSGLALQAVGPDGDGEEYAKIKAKHRWGYPD